MEFFHSKENALDSIFSPSPFAQDIPGVIGDIKAHTWNNGVIQTYKAYPDGKFASAGRNFNGTVCAEFIGDLDGKLTGLGSYSVEKIIFYAD